MHLVASHKCVEVHFTLGLGNGSLGRGTTYRLDNLNSIPGTHMNSGKSTIYNCPLTSSPHGHEVSSVSAMTVHKSNHNITIIPIMVSSLVY